MAYTAPSIQIFSGIYEELSNVSLRREKQTGKRIALLIFDRVKALEGLNSFTKKPLNSILLKDEEGEISITPNSTQFIFAGAEGDELQRVECKVEIERDDHWDRFMRFMHRYAEANGMAYGNT